MKIAEDSDFCMLKWLVDEHDGWKLEYDSNSENIKVLYYFAYVLIYKILSKLSIHYTVGYNFSHILHLVVRGKKVKACYTYSVSVKCNCKFSIWVYN